MSHRYTLEEIQNFEGKYPKQLWYLFTVEMWERLANAWKIEIPNTGAKGNVVKVTIQTIKEAMKYSPAEFKVPAGATVELIFENVDLS